MRSRGVAFRNEGRLDVSRGRLWFGFASNRVTMAPGERGVFEIGAGGVCAVTGQVRVARSCKVYVAGRLALGAGTYVNPGTFIFARESVTIGSGCAISWNCSICDDDFHDFSLTGATSAPIRIGDRVWIGMNATIVKGVTVGDGAVVAAGSVVVRDVPAGALVGGNPARVLREGVTWQ